MTSGIIFDLRKYSIHDGPGIRTTVFFKGCPLSCAWCHNPEGQSKGMEILYRPARCIHCEACREACPAQAIAYMFSRENAHGQDSPGLAQVVLDRRACHAYRMARTCSLACAQACYAEALQATGREVTVEQVLAEVERDRPFYEQSNGGVTFSGGEPLLQREFLLELLKACQAHGLHTAVDTCGYASWEGFQEIIPYTNLFLYDLKIFDSALHRQYTGAPNELIVENLRRLSQSGAPARVRIPLVPGINDDEANIRRSGEFLASLSNIELVEVLPYHASAIPKYEGLGIEYHLKDTPSPSDEKMSQVIGWLQEYNLRVR